MAKNFIESAFNPTKEFKNHDFQNTQDYILKRAEKYCKEGRDLYLIDAVTGVKRSFKDLEQETKCIASLLYKQGMRKGDSVSFLSRELSYIHAFYIGVWRANGFIRMSYCAEEEDTILSRVKESGSKWLLCDVEDLDKCENIRRRVNWPVKIIVNGLGKSDGKRDLIDFMEYFKDDGQSCPKTEVGLDDIAMVLCTSGTTGKSKGAVYHHGTMINSSMICECLPLMYPKPNYFFTSAGHFTATLNPLASIASGKCIITSTNYTDAELLYDSIEKYKPGVLFAFPGLLSLLLLPEASKRDLSSLEILLSGGATVSTPFQKSLLKSLPNIKSVVVGYGCTEVGWVSTSCGSHAEYPEFYTEVPEGNIGMLMPSVNVMVVNEESLKPLGPNKTGEICLKTGAMFQGYFNNEEATKNAMINGWYRSGDVGHYDEKGWLYFSHRSKDIFKYKGIHVSPTEIEGVILSHPAVHQVIVTKAPYSMGDYVPRAWVILKSDIPQTTEVLKDIKEFTDGKVADFKQLRGGVCAVTSFPRAPSGKMARRFLQDKDPSQASFLYIL